jgi:predicted nucleic acid-binding protein
MLPLRLVIDTNVVVSAALKPEYADVLALPELGIRKGVRQQLLQLIKNKGHIVTPPSRLQVSSDLDDNMFLECADAARADYLITGNQKHFPRFWKKTKIITARDFISLSAPHLIK